MELRRRAARGERRSLEQLGGEEELGELQHRELSFGLRCRAERGIRAWRRDKGNVCHLID